MRRKRSALLSEKLTPVLTIPVQLTLNTLYWGLSSAGRAPALHAGGQRFDPARLHHFLGKPRAQSTMYRGLLTMVDCALFFGTIISAS
jgi:hypothetical protein